MKANKAISKIAEKLIEPIEKNAGKPLIKSDNLFPVVGIGASAGGLDAFKKLLKAIPEDSGMAYVLVQHLDPNHESILHELLQKVTNIPVLEIADNIKVQPDHIYIIPSNKMMIANDGVLKLSTRPPKNKNQRNLPIDLFFASLAEVHQSHAIGVVLSGTASDGTQGLKAIKDHGGITFAQDEASAAYEGMPQNAVQAGVVDFILPPEKIPQKLLEVINIINGNGHSTEDFPIKDEDVFKQILSLLRIRKGTDFTYYKQTTIRRRILRRMAINKNEEPAAYLKYLRDNKTEQDFLYLDLLIPVTSFFRDAKTFDNLCETIFPSIIKNKIPGEPIRFWVAGCSTGEEAYSVAICLKELFRNSSLGEGRDGTVQIFATDISEPAIAIARAGIYSKTDIEGLTPQRLQDFFTKTDGGYQAKKSIRGMCVFAEHNFLKDPPFSKMDFISCRNVLIYMEPYLQKKALNTFHYSLNPKGFLLLGKSETTSGVPELFAAEGKSDKLFTRKDAPTRFIHTTSIRSEQSFTDNNTLRKTENLKTDFQKTADDIILGKYTPASVVVNEAMDIVHFRGNTGNYLQQLPGKPSHNLLKMAKEGLAFELRNILHKAKKEKVTVIKENIPLDINGVLHNITIEGLLLPDTIELYYLVLFHENKPLPISPKSLAKRKVKANSQEFLRIAQLEKELAQSREDMRSITEDQEAANEELQSANEELLSSSEELQSLNEELETSKEELQSTNEELMVVNQEMISLNEQVTTAKDYAEAIIANIHEPLLVLDKNLRIKSANNAFYKTFQVNEKETESVLIYDVGNKQWDIPKLRTLLENILPEKSIFNNFEVRHNFSTIGEKVMLLNAREVVNKNSTEKLILLSIEDITQRKAAAKKIKDSEELFTSIADNISQFVWMADEKGRVYWYNQRWYDYTGTTLEEMQGWGWQKLLHPNHLERVVSRIQHSWDTAEIWEDTFPLKGKDGKYRWFLSRAVPIYDEQGKIIRWFGSNTDITEQEVLIEKLGDTVDKLTLYEKVIFNIQDAVLITEAEPVNMPGPRIVFANEAFYKMTGYTEEETIGQTPRILQGPKTDRKQLDKIRTAVENWETERVELINYAKDGREFYVDFEIVPVTDEKGWFTHWVSVQRDVTEKVLARKKIEESEERLRLATETSGVGIWQWNVITNLIHWDAQMFHIYGIKPTPDGLIQYSDWSNAVAPEELAEQEKILQATLKNMGSSNRSFKILRNSDGMLRNIEAVETVRTNANGQAEWVIGTNIDVTERKQADQKLQESENRFRLMAELIPQKMWTADSEGNKNYFNKKWLEYTGLPYDELKDWGWKKIVHPDDWEATKNQWQKSIDTSADYEMENRLLRKDGEYLWHLTRATALKDSDGKIKMWVGSKTETQIQKKQKDELEKAVLSRTNELQKANMELNKKHQELSFAKEQLQTEYSRKLIEASLDPVVTISVEGKITDVNEASVIATGIKRDELIGTSFSNYFTENEKAQQGYQQAFEKGFISDYPLTLKHKNGELKDVLYNASVYKNDRGEVLGVFAAARDVTEQKRIATELTEARIFAEFATSLAEEAKEKAEKAVITAEEAVKAKQQFLSNMSHEIRTPMNAIIGFTKVVLKTDLSPKQKEYISAIKISGDALIVLINDILDIAKVDAGKMTFEKAPFKLALSIDAMLNLFETKILEKNLILVKEYDEKIPTVLIGDAIRLHQIILNLVSNAVKFTEYGFIKVAVKLLGQDDEKVTVEFSITDTGIGIREEKLQFIFENFTQASAITSRLYGGSGLGLAIVKQLVDLQGGNIAVNSTINEGSTFSFILNFDKSDSDEIVEAEIMQLDESVKDIKILVVEDMPLNQLLMKTLLDDFGFESDVTANGKLALEKLSTKAYDIILMDLQMPEMNGFEATEYIRNTLESNIPIIALTADVTTVDVAKCKAVGMNDYIAKPIDERLLYNKIISLVKKPVVIVSKELLEEAIEEQKIIKCTDLTYLNTRTKSNPVLMMQMMSIYLEQTPPLITLMKKSFAEKDWDSLDAAVHKMIPSFGIIGMHKDYEAMAKKIQRYAVAKQEEEGIAELITQLENILGQSCREIEIEFNNMKNKSL